MPISSYVNQLSDGGSDGTVLGQSPADKISFYGAEPVARPSVSAGGGEPIEPIDPIDPVSVSPVAGISSVPTDAPVETDEGSGIFGYGEEQAAEIISTINDLVGAVSVVNDLVSAMGTVNDLVAAVDTINDLISAAGGTDNLISALAQLGLIEQS